MHVGAKKTNCPSLKIDEWEVKVIEDYDTNENIVKDEYCGEHRMEESDSEKYLGDLISSNGRNEKNVEERKSKGTEQSIK